MSYIAHVIYNDAILRTVRYAMSCIEQSTVMQECEKRHGALSDN